MLYPKNIEHKIGFDEIRTLLRGHCISRLGIERVNALTFTTQATAIRQALEQVTELRQLVDTEGVMPGEDFFDLRAHVAKLRIEGQYLDEHELWELKRALDTMHAWIAIIRQDETPYPALEKLAEGVFTFLKVTQAIEGILDKYGHVKDSASPELSRIRLDLRRSEGSANRTLITILESAKREGLVENNVLPAMRDGRLVIPISPAVKRRIRGIVHDESASGKTVFIEPQQVVEANNRIRELEAAEKREIIRILQAFTDALRPNQPELRRALDFMADIELVIAKERLASQLGANCPRLGDTPHIDWTLARHPLLELSLRRQGKKIVPLEIKLTRQKRMLVISGPNAGGKSVCLKTVGLLQYMLQCGLPITVGENSETGIFDDMFIDIGDEQSIEADLSTYSSHLINMKQMMRSASAASLLLVDEMGSGTEPNIGGAMAEAVMRRFIKSGTFGIITTHYQNLKNIADESEAVVNGAMLYDRSRMEALFQLQIGNPGSSFAVEIARKIGIPEDVIAEASDIVGRDYINADKYLLDIARDKRYWEGKRQTIHNREKDMERTIEQYERDVTDLQKQRKDIIRQAKAEAAEIVAEARAKIENTIREIREASAERDKTRELRQELEDYRQQLEAERQAAKQAQSDAIDRKMEQIMQRRQRQADRKANKGKGQQGVSSQDKAQPVAPSLDTPIAVGATVRIKGQTAVGTVEEISGKRATVIFGQLRTIADVKRLESAKPEKQQQQATPSANILVSRATQEQIHQTQLHFRQEIDVRGMRAAEAIEAITRYVDDATLVGASQVRILHGTGTGALRQALRQYLRTVPNIASAHDEHVQFGGAGITVVEFA